MIVHIALFQWKKDATKERIDKAMEDVRQLKSKVPGVVDIMCGENFSPHAKNFTHAVVVIVKDRTALKAYRDHPEHRVVAKEIEEMGEVSDEVGEEIGVDFEV